MPSEQTDNLVAPSAVAIACSGILDQCARLARGLDQDTYTAPSVLLKGGTIGKHLRHTLDHVAAVTGCDGRAIDYDHRSRGGSVESDPEAACEAIGAVCAQLGSLADEDFDREVPVRFMFNGSGDQAELRSTLGRELAFAMHHAIHHQAMMRAIVVEHGGEVPEDFGMAPDTIRHNKQAGS